MSRGHVTDGATPASEPALIKYQTAAKVANEAMAFAVGKLAPGASILDICRRTDAFIAEAAGRAGSDKGGVAFPCCISLNNTLAYFSPAEDASDVVLGEGDLAKIELGVHSDGFPVLLASTQAVGASAAHPASAEASNLIQAAHLLAQAASRLLRPGANSQKIQEQLQRMCAELGVNFVEGMISHAVGQNRLAADKMLAIRPSADQHPLVRADCVLEPHDVFVVDVAISAGSGAAKYRSEVYPTIYKRTGESHGLRLKTSRAVLHDAANRFGMMAFNLRDMNGVRSRMGLQECCQHQVVTAYEVLHEADKSALTARVMFTTVLLPEGGPLVLTDHQHPAASIKPTCSVQSDDLKQLLASAS